MRAFRIYRPQILGFNDEFDKAKAPPAPEPTATQELEEVESSVPQSPATPEAESDPSPIGTEKQQESELFLDANGSSGNW